MSVPFIQSPCTLVHMHFLRSVGLSLFLQLSQLVKVILISAHLFIRLNHISQYIVQQQIHVAF